MNAKGIKNKIKEENIDMHAIFYLLLNCHQFVSSYLKNVYSLDKLAYENDKWG